MAVGTNSLIYRKQVVNPPYLETFETLQRLSLAKDRLTVKHCSLPPYPALMSQPGKIPFIRPVLNNRYIWNCICALAHFKQFSWAFVLSQLGLSL